MAVFQYSAFAGDGRQTTGQLDAPDRSAAFRQLDAQNLQPLALVEISEKPKKVTPSPSHDAPNNSQTLNGVKLKAARVLEFTEELSELIKGGIQLEPSLGIMERRRELSSIKDIAATVRGKLRDGIPFSRALQETSPSFGDLYCNLVAAGEISGSLGEILERQAEHLRSMAALKGRVLFALIYPSFLIASAVGVSILFLVFLIPKLMELLDSTGGSLPLGAQLVVNAGELAKTGWPVALIVVVLLIGGGIWWSKSNQLSWDQFKLRWPLMGRVFRERFHVQFLETLANLTKNGLPLNKALELTRAATANRFFRTKLDTVMNSISDGVGLSKSIDQAGDFPSLMIDMIAVGEETGDLSGSLERTAIRFDRELNKRVDRMSAIIQPSVVVLMAGMVGAMAYLMISAIFQTISGLG